MALNDALTAVGFTLILSIGLQLIGRAQFAARRAREHWRDVGGPEAVRLVREFGHQADLSATHLRRAADGLAGAARQIRDEVS